MRFFVYYEKNPGRSEVVKGVIGKRNTFFKEQCICIFTTKMFSEKTCTYPNNRWNKFWKPNRSNRTYHYSLLQFSLIYITNLFGKEKYHFIENRVSKDLRALFRMMKMMIMMITCKNKASFKLKIIWSLKAIVIDKNL